MWPIFVTTVCMAGFLFTIACIINRKFDYRSFCLKNFIVLVDTYGKIVSVAINDSRDFIFTHSFELYWLISLKNLSSDIFFWFSSSFW